MCNFGTVCQMPNICSALKSKLSTHMLLIIELQYKIDIVAMNFCTDVHLYILHPVGI